MKSLLLRHLQVFLSSCGGLSRRPVSTLLTLSGIGVALSLPMLLYVLVTNVSGIVGDWDKGPRLSLFLELSVTREQAESTVAALRRDEDVERVSLIDREQGLDELLGRGSLSALRERLDVNPLPHVIEVLPTPPADPRRYRSLSLRLAALPGVEQVRIDLEWVERLRAFTAIAGRLALVLWALLLCGVALVIANSVRMGIMTSRDEIEVVGLVGGSRAFIRRPFLYAGVIQAVGGALVAAGIAGVVVALLGPHVESLFETYGSQAEFRGVPVSVTLVTLPVTASIGWVSAHVTVTRHLRILFP